jgi:hypothetical protein
LSEPEASAGQKRKESAATCVQAEPPGAEGNNLQQPPCHRDVLKEVDELVLIAQLVMKG